MTPRQLIKFFGTQVEAASALGVTQPAVSHWVKRGAVPAKRQTQAADLSRGALRISRALARHQ